MGDEEQQTMKMRHDIALASKLLHRNHIINKNMEKTYRIWFYWKVKKWITNIKKSFPYIGLFPFGIYHFVIF